MQVFFITLILHSKEHITGCTFSVILNLHEYLHFYYKLSLDKKLLAHDSSFDGCACDSK